MKHFISLVALCMVIMPAIAATPGGAGRRSMAAQMAAPRQASNASTQAAMASIHIVGKPANVGGNTGDNNGDNNNSGNNGDNSGNNGGDNGNNNEKPDDTPKPVDTREKEKTACLSGNIGLGNTFVWASKFSNTGNYASMVEDIENPENNTCFVRVELKSSDSKVDLSDIPAQYFEMGRTITCGSWADEGAIKKRILDAKKSARTWGTVAGAVGGAGLGVGVMELAGNKLIGGKVEGQFNKNLSKTDLRVSQLLVLKDKSQEEYKKYMTAVADYVKLCKANTSLSDCDAGDKEMYTKICDRFKEDCKPSK